MTREFTAEWDKVGERIFQGGIDRGMFYVPGSSSLTKPWNGLVSVEDNTNVELKSYYQDGLRVLNHVVPGNYEGKLTAITYPDIFDAYAVGHSAGETNTSTGGLDYYDQHFGKKFHMSYRSKIKSDSEEELGYKIHILYNLTAVPDPVTFQTLTEEGVVTLFSWLLSGVPDMLNVSAGRSIRPTAHVSIDSRSTPEALLTTLENSLYGQYSGGVWSPGSCPSLSSLRTQFGHHT